MRRAISPFIAPMEIKYLKSIFIVIRKRTSIALSFFVCLNLLVLTPGLAQLKNQRRVTDLQLAAAPEGSRVTVVSDSPLNDYEAFRRGERFYVKIPLADFMSALPHFRADGFENVQVQKVGDSLIVSFKLQPGATARINQHGNRLDVVFSAPGKTPYNNTASSGSSNNEGRSGAPQTSSDRGQNAAGPMPPGSSTSRDRFAPGRAASIGQFGSTRNTRFPNNRNSRTTEPDSAVAAASPMPSASTTFSPTPYTNYEPLTIATPETSNSIAVSSRSESSNWSTRRAAARRWISANRFATLLGVLIVLSITFYLAAAIRSRKKNVVQARGAKAKVQPKYSSGEQLNELPGSVVNDQVPPRDKALGQQPGSTPAVASPAQDRRWELTKPTIVSPSPGNEQGDQEEREVFEL
jgi:hypothetical protein